MKLLEPVEAGEIGSFGTKDGAAMRSMHRTANRRCYSAFSLLPLLLPVALVVVFLHPVRAASEVVVTFEDEFDGKALGPAWSWEDQTGGSSYVVVDGGTLQIRVVKNPARTSGDATFRLLKAEPAAPYSFETQTISGSEHAGAFTGLGVYKDEGNWLLGGWRGPGRLEFSGVVNGRSLPAIGVADTQYSWLRIRKGKSNPLHAYYTYYFDASPDGVNWTNVNVYADRSGFLHDGRTRIGYLGRDATRDTQVGYSLIYSHFREYGEDRMPSRLVDYLVVPNTAQVAQLTGRGSPINGSTAESADVCGTDLGIPFHWRNSTYLAFGDTLGCERGAGFRPNALAASLDTAPADGLHLAEWITGHGRQAKPVVNRTTGKTAIPTGAVGLGSSAYIYFMEVARWDGPAGAWSCDFASIASADAAAPSEWTNHAASIRWGPGNFNQLAVLRDATTSPATLYIYGIPCGRFGSVKLMKVLETQVLNKGAYSYLSGFSGFGVPVWSADEAQALTIAGGPVGELSVGYNAWLGRYTMTYLDEGKKGIVIREAPSPWGPWGGPIVIARASDYPKLYGAFLSGHQENDGQTIYYTMSQWDSYNVFWMRTTLLVR